MKQVRRRRKSFVIALAVLLALMLAVPALAAANSSDETVAQITSDGQVLSGKAIACGVGIGVAAAGGALAMGLAAGKATESMARQPEASGTIRTTLMLGLVFIETAIIYALLVVILVIFVL